MAFPVASSSRLPGYASGPQDAISRVPSLSALHPDPTHPAHARLLSGLDLSADGCRLWANSQSGITLCPQAMTPGQTDLEVSRRGSGRSSVVPVELKLTLTLVSSSAVYRAGLARQATSSSSARRAGKLTASPSRSSPARVCSSLKTKEGERRTRCSAETSPSERKIPPAASGSRRASTREYKRHCHSCVWKHRASERINSADFCLHCPVPLRFAFALNLPPDMCVVVDEQAARVYHYVVATAVGSAKGFFGKDLSAEERVYPMTVPIDHDGELTSSSSVRAKLGTDLPPRPSQI